VVIVKAENIPADIRPDPEQRRAMTTGWRELIKAFIGLFHQLHAGNFIEVEIQILLQVNREPACGGTSA
jgi:hypothetical protein